MPLIKALEDAAAQNIISADQSSKLQQFLSQRGLLKLDADDRPAGAWPDLSAPVNAEPPNANEASEAPRLIRGFHDILITIGVIAAVGGLWSLIGVAPSIVTIWLLAEFLVIRQRLAFPAFVLTVLFVAAIAAASSEWIGFAEQEGDEIIGPLLLFFAVPLMLVPFYWRFRIPVALAALILSAILWALYFVLAIIAAASGEGSLTGSLAAMPQITGAIAMAFALLMFAAAMYFDMRDPRRQTRRSDVAFWLHLGAAPALLYAAFAFFLFDSGLEAWWGDNPGFREAATALSIISVLMVIGIIIDRRAFVTSGLISLGAAIVIIAREANIDMSELAALPVFLVGLIVLTLGTGWQFLRRVIVANLPDSIRLKVPPLIS